MTGTLPTRTSPLGGRRPLAHPPGSSTAVPGVIWERIDTESYAVSVDGRTVGFVDVVGAVFVSLAGPRYDRAEEIAQSLLFERAVAVLVAPSSRAA
jgi:hypothetical protein